MIPIFLKCTLPVFTDIVFLACPAGNQLHDIRDYIPAGLIKYEQMNGLM